MRLKHSGKRTMHPAMNFGASVTNCESNMYTAATLRLSQDLRSCVTWCTCHSPPASDLHAFRKRAQHWGMRV